MIENLIRKSYNLNLNKKIVSYTQLSYYQCLEYITYSQDKNFNLENWLLELFWEEEINWKWIDMEKLMQELYKTAFKWFFGSKESKKTEIERIKEKYEYLSLLISRADKWSIDPIRLLKEYTPEQINILTDGLIYHINEWDKKGQNRNRIMIEKEATPDTERQEILKMTSQLSSKKKKWLIKSV